MKKSGTTIVFVLVCIGVLVAAFAIGLGIRKIRLGGAETSTSPGVIDAHARRTSESSELSEEEKAAVEKERAGLREKFDNFSEEEKEKFRAQVRERFSGKRGDSGPQLSDEDRAKMREEFEALRANWQDMTDAEREEARKKISEKYGFTPRGLGGGRGFGDREGGRRRPAIRPDAGQLENN
ncbi:MAG: hypothetical protein ACYSUX_09130 [Planctomycetota bacterium]|jgi:hypothetical protein